VQSSGNMFVGQETTLDDTKLAELKGQLARIEADRIAKQSRYELTLNSPAESLGEILDNLVLRGYEQQINQLSREKAALEITYTPKHEKVQKLEAQLELLQKTYQTEVASVKNRIKSDYESALRQEKLLSGAYATQSQRVGAEAAKAAEYNSLKREVETSRQMYQSLLMQENQAGMSSSVPITPIRIVEPSSPPAAPYKPRPLVNLSFGAMLGFALTVAIAFVRERMDRSIRSPGTIQSMLAAPELGVIPNLEPRTSNALTRWIASRAGNQRLTLGATVAEPRSELEKWQNAPAFLTESFRGTLASLLRTRQGAKEHKVILVTSPGAGEGKTTIVQNLGIALAETGRKVLLIDGDFRRPHLHKRFGLPNNWTFSDVLTDKTPVFEYQRDRLAIKTAIPDLWVLPNRPVGENLGKLLYSPRLGAFIDACRNQFDTILVDVPPVLYFADARVLAPATDGVVLVIRSGVTNRDSAMRAYQQIQSDGLTLLGTVLTAYDSAGYNKHYYEYAADAAE